LIILGFHLFFENGVLQAFNIPPAKLINFLSAIQSKYHMSNPYHNRIHASDVLHSCQYFMADENIAAMMTPLDMLILYFASAIHDFDHPGVNNNFLINSSAAKAIMYNDKSVLENHHVAASFLVLEQEDNNFLSGLSKPDYKQFRQWVIECVLATDLSLHFQYVSMFKAKMAQKDEFQPATKMDDKLNLWKVLVKCADVNHPSRPIDIHLKMSKMCFDEFFRQGDEEKRLAIPISPFMDRETTKMGSAQIGFIDFICLPLFEVVDSYIPITEVIDNLKSNRNYWKKVKEDEEKGIPYILK